MRAVGLRAEKAVERYLKRQGWLVLPTHMFSGPQDSVAPMMRSSDPSKSIILPDLLMSDGKGMRWIEVKYKTHADFTRITGRFETGIGLRLWHHYRKIGEQTRVDVWIYFCHSKEDEVRSLKVTDVGNRCRISKIGAEQIIFFPWDDLVPVCKLSEINK
jgi:hypothetical protein